MKILHLVTKRQYRGAEIFAANLSDELIKLGHKIIFAGLYKNNGDILQVKKAKNIDLSGKETKLFSAFLVLKIVRLIKREKPDIIQCNGSDTLKYMYFATYFLSKKPPIIYRNISMISKWMSGSSKKKAYQKIFKKISHVSSVGDEAMKDFLDTFDYPEQCVSVVRRGIPVKIIDKEEARLNVIREFKLNDEDRFVVHMGNFSPEKNHVFLLDIFERMKKEHPHIKLLLVGNGQLYQDIIKFVEDKNLEETIFFTGFCKNVNKYLAAADCLALCSLVEGVPGVILEAGVQSTPSISTNVGGVNEVLINNSTGFVIDDFDSINFYEKLILLMTNPKLNSDMGKQAFELVTNEFGTESNAKKFEELYSKLIIDNPKV